MAILESEKMKRLKGLTRSGLDFEELKSHGASKRASGRFAKHRHARRERAAWKREIASVVGDDGVVDEQIERDRANNMDMEREFAYEFYFTPFPSYEQWLEIYGFRGCGDLVYQWRLEMVDYAIDNRYEIDFGHIRTLDDAANFLKEVDPMDILCHKSILRPIVEKMRPF